MGQGLRGESRYCFCWFSFTAGRGAVAFSFVIPFSFVDPEKSSNQFIHMGVSQKWNQTTVGGEHPHIDKQGLINPGSTVLFKEPALLVSL